jgi:hypothetical protein
METAKNSVGGSLVDVRVREEIAVPDPATGDLHATGRDGVEFYTERKVVIERWQ